MDVSKDRIKKQLDQNLPFVLYCKPNSATVLGLLQQNDTLYEVNDFTESGFVFASFDGKSIHCIPDNSSDSITFDKKSLPSTVDQASIFEVDVDAKVDFQNLVGDGIKAIDNNQFKKVVLSRKESVELQHFDLMVTFQKLIQLYSTAFVYCLYHPKVGTWLGATPEQLVKAEDTVFETISLAGTQKDQGASEVIWHQKEQEEQQFVTDYIIEKLKNKASKLEVSKPYSVKAGMIWHIKTTISGVFNEETNLQEIVKLLHPTPAVCGLPKEVAKDFIIANEGYDRSFYTGFLGELNRNAADGGVSSDLFVNLRCMKIEDKTAHIFIGCGITKDSNPEREWEESVNKSMTMKRVL